MDECGGPNGTEDADGCVWEPLLFYGGIESYNANHENIEAVMVGREGRVRNTYLPVLA